MSARSCHRMARALAAGALALALGATPVAAQELEPRAYSPNPMGVSYVLLSYSFSTGDVLVDPTIPLTDVEADVNGLVLGYGRTFGLFGKSANAALLLPYAWMTASGNVQEAFTTVERSGLADLRGRVGVNLLGGPALTREEFAKRRPRTTLGASLVVSAPTGEYDPSKVVNLSSHRWALKPEVGLSHPAGPLTLEAYAGVWFYTDNTEFFGGSTKEQDPLATFQAHVAYTFKPRLWLSGDATFYTGGSTTVDGVENDDRQENSRFGFTGSLPLNRAFSLKIAWAKGAITRASGEFESVGAALQYSWF